MLTLLIENCTERAVIAFVEGDHCLYMAGLPFGLHNSRFLVPKIQEGLHTLGKKVDEFDLITVGVGPGSYTGIRVGTVVAKSLSYASKIPLVGVCSLEGFVPDCDGNFAAIFDAKMAGAYILTGTSHQGVITYNSSPRVCKIEELGSALVGVDILVSPCCQGLQSKISPILPGSSWIWQETGPDPIHMVRRAEEKWTKGEFSLDGSLEVMYLRDPADASKKP